MIPRGDLGEISFGIVPILVLQSPLPALLAIDEVNFL